MVLNCAKYGPGDLRQSVEFQRITRASDGAGGWTETWARIAAAPSRAMVRQLSGSEAWRFDRINIVANLMVVVRYSAAITPADRVMFQGRAHNITSVNNVDFENKWLEIAVTQGVAT
jgi:SPP1 family predicted phage head-tail adaptor